MNGPVINIPAYDPKVAGIRTRPSLNGPPQAMDCHASMAPIQISPFGKNEVKISIDGVTRIVDAFALIKATQDALQTFRKMGIPPRP